MKLNESYTCGKCKKKAHRRQVLIFIYKKYHVALCTGCYVRVVNVRPQDIFGDSENYVAVYAGSAPHIYYRCHLCKKMVIEPNDLFRKLSLYKYYRTRSPAFCGHHCHKEFLFNEGRQ